MKLIPGKCPECKENININGEKRAVICPNCNEPIVVEDAIELPEELTKISSCLFSCCASLKEFKIPSTVKEIEVSAYCDCTSLKEVTIPPHVQKIGMTAFIGCSQLEHFNLPPSLSYLTDLDLYGSVNYETRKDTYAILYGTPLRDKYIESVRMSRLAQNKCPICGRKLSLFTKKCPLNHTW